MLKEDRISQLPDPLICHILSHLPIEDSVKTSVLSTRWRSLWLWAPCLDLDSRSFPDSNAFMSFGNRFFDFNRVSGINKLKLNLDDDTNYEVDYASDLMLWVEAALKRKVQHLEVWCPSEGFYEIPSSLRICETLVSVKLFEVVMGNAEFVSLPCLKTMHLKYIWFPNEATFETLVSCCPLLEELEILGFVNPLKVIRVHSLSLKRLEINLRDCMGDKYGVVIDAPLLRSLTIADDIAGSYIINNWSSNAKLDIYLSFVLYNSDDEASISSRISSIRDFLLGISKVGEMIIYLNTLKVICQYSKLEPLPQFVYMSSLYAYIFVPDLNWLLSFLESCPNLKSLILVWDFALTKMHFEELSQISYTFVPECLLSSLKSVEIKASFSGYAAEMEVVKYFLENSVILEKLTLHLHYGANVEVIFKKLLEIPKRSNTCQLVVR